MQKDPEWYRSLPSVHVLIDSIQFHFFFLFSSILVSPGDKGSQLLWPGRGCFQSKHPAIVDEERTLSFFVAPRVEICGY